MKCMSNDYTNPNTNPKTLTALTLTLNDPHDLINKFFMQFLAEKLQCQRTRYVLKFLSNNFFFFSLFHQRADDEALTRFLQTSLFLVASPILVKSMFLSFRSSLTLSIHFFLCLPLLLFPSTCPCKAAFGNLFSSILSTCLITTLMLILPLYDVNLILANAYDALEKNCECGWDSNLETMNTKYATLRAWLFVSYAMVS